ncbi:nitroreductase family protein [Patescibacteria group bacterium]|nr:nitroreductase family protein [Patescibacteria group bacterium]
MDFCELIKKRHSIRCFAKKEITSEHLKKILNAANLAPSAGNLQSYQIFTVKKQAAKDQLALAAFGQNFIASAPIVLVMVADSQQSAAQYGQRGKELYAIQDATIAGAYAQLMIRELGLGSCWVGAFDSEAVREIISVSAEMIPVAIIPVGYPAVPGSRAQRKNLNEIVNKI